MFVDSHCHLQLMDYTKLGLTMGEVVANAADAKVNAVLCVATTFSDTHQLYEITQRFTSQYPNLFISVGLHSLTEMLFEPVVKDYVDAAKHPKVIAIGENGLDYYRVDQENADLQRARFVTQINAARECNKPLIVHTRAAREDTIKILRQHNAREVGGILHCFTEDYEMASQAIDLGFYISFSGIVTFKNAVELQEVVKKVPLEHILIETDSPYLSPMPLRGQTNQPSHVIHVAQGIADLKGVSVHEVANITTKNFTKLFKLVL
jgi:TatD DNase family protein